MKLPLSARLRIAALAVLAFGLAAGALVYFVADEETDSDSYVVVGGQVFAVDPSDNRAYRRELQRFGGKASLVFDDLLRWFEARWRGKALGVTIAWLSAFVACGLFWLARFLE